MSTYTQDTEEITGYDIVTLKKGNHTIIPITTAEAVVWHEDDDVNMTLRDKIESLNFTPGETTTKYTGGQGISINNENEISVVVDGTTIVSNNGTLSVKDLGDQISAALSDYLSSEPLITTKIVTSLTTPGNPNTLYLKSIGNAPDSFEEYIWIEGDAADNGGYFEKLGTAQLDASKLDKVYNVIFETVQGEETNKFKKVYEAVFYTNNAGDEVDNIYENKALITKISTELGANDDTENTIYGRLNKLEDGYNNIAELSFEDTGYKLNYEFSIKELYDTTTSN